MNAPYTSDRLKALFQSSYAPSEWRSCLQRLFHADELRAVPETLDGEQDKGEYLGAINTPDHFRIGLFHYEISHGSVVKKRVGLRNLVKSFINPRWGEFDAALVAYESGAQWRLSFICDIRGEATSPKRFTYVFGNQGLLYRTPIERFRYLQEKGVSFANIKNAFSVEALSDEFFNRYREQYADFVQYITGKRYVKSGSKWEERVVSHPHPTLMQAFGGDDKRVRDYVKKMMGRLTFLHFLQRKGWMCGDLNYLQHLFEQSAYQDDYLDSVLEPLFFGILNTKPAEREALFTSQGWDMELLAAWKEIPYLNGGLFECDDADATQCRFPSRYFRDLFQFFSEYNFTIDENDPTDAEIGVDPEMLGKIFENLLEDNKDKGAFYTPKEIVRYMCQESLIAYLNTNTSIAAEKIRRFVLSPEEGVNDIPENKKAKLLNVLKEVKICDPAIGSGAFPMGLLNELLHCREVLSGEQYDRAEIKKSIIQNNIYGVDIEKGAVDIARLRFWLSIVVDEETPSPLPNLDYKIMQGNSLIESFMGVDLSKLTADSIKDLQPSLFDDMQYTIKKLITQQLQFYYACSDHEKKFLIRQEIAKWINNQLKVLSIDSRILTLLQQLDLAGNKQFFLWHTWFSDVFNRANGKDGFDIVIGNPPYVEAKKLKYIANTLRCHYSIYSGTADLSIYFIELAMNILRTNGIACYITTNKFFNTGYGKPVRRMLIDKHIHSIINFEQVEVFEGILVSSVVLNIRKSLPTSKNMFTYERFYQLDSKQFRSEFINRTGSFGKYPQEYLDEHEWSFANLAELMLKQKIEKKSQSLSNVNGINIYRGVTTGYNPAFIIDNTKKDELIEEDIRNGEIIKNMLQGRNIRKWYYNESHQYLLNTEYEINIPHLYPFIYMHLLDFEKALIERSDQGINWWNLRVCKYYNEFEQSEKIIWGLTANNWAFAYDDKQHYLPSNGYILTSAEVPIKYLLGWINSKLMNHYFKYIGVMTAGGAYTLKAATIEALPYKSPTDYRPITRIVNEILVIKSKDKQADTSALEAEIDRLVYQLYGLTDEEIAIIEKANE